MLKFIGKCYTDCFASKRRHVDHVTDKECQIGCGRRVKTLENHNIHVPLLVDSFDSSTHDGIAICHQN